MSHKRAAVEQIDKSNLKRVKFQQTRVLEEFTVFQDEQKQCWLPVRDLVNYLKEREAGDTWETFIAKHRVKDHIPLTFSFDILRQVRCDRPNMLFEIHELCHIREQKHCKVCNQSIRIKPFYIINEQIATKLRTWYPDRDDFIPYLSAVHSTCVIAPALQTIVYCREHSSNKPCIHSKTFMRNCLICFNKFNCCGICLDAAHARCDHCTKQHCPKCNEKKKTTKTEDMKEDNKEAKKQEEKEKEAKKDDKKEIVKERKSEHHPFVLYHTTEKWRKWYEEEMFRMSEDWHVEVIEAKHKQFSNPYFSTKALGFNAPETVRKRDEMLINIVKAHLSAEKAKKDVSADWTGVQKLRKVPCEEGGFKVIATEQFWRGEIIALYTGLLCSQKELEDELEDPTCAPLIQNTDIEHRGQPLAIAAHKEKYGSICKYIRDGSILSGEPGKASEHSRINCVITEFTINTVSFIVYSARHIIKKGTEVMLNFFPEHENPEEDEDDMDEEDDDLKVLETSMSIKKNKSGLIHD